MFDAAHSTASTSSGLRPARSSACFAALTPISAMIDNSSSPRSSQRGAMISGSSTGALAITWRALIPLAFSMKPVELSVSGSTSPAAIASALRAFCSAT